MPYNTQEIIYNPLKEYNEVFRDRFKTIAEGAFAEYTAEAGIDIEANQATCAKLYAAQEQDAALHSSRSRWTVLCVFLWLCVAAGIIAIIACFDTIDPAILVAIGAGVVGIVCLLLLLVHPTMKRLAAQLDELANTIAQLQDEAWKQMEPLNRLYDWDVLARMMVKTVPNLQFDPYFTNQRLIDLQNTYGWDNSFNNDRSVLFSHSGVINGNPFVICRTKKMEWGSKTYEGHKTIHWTERVYVNGKWETRPRSQTLHAYYTAPLPEYYQKTRLFYANDAAPDLVFSRNPNNLACKHAKGMAYKHHLKKLSKIADDLEKHDYAMLPNEEFEVCFDTSNRNSNHQFNLLFTPLAQQSMLQLLADDDHIGYGDDFSFVKEHKINTIIPEHLQSTGLDLDPMQYRYFDYERAKDNFCTLNGEYFRSIYFAFAPLLCVPAYQQIRTADTIYGRDMQRHSAYWEHESLANYWGQGRFAHPACATECILKTSQSAIAGNSSTINVTAYGYRIQKRVEIVSVYGDDGHYHNVEVPWDEYLPVTGNGTIQMVEDNEAENPDATHLSRADHICTLLSNTGCDNYRRHIASHL